MTLAALIEEARACTACAAELPHPPRPIFMLAPEARILIIGQAPGARAHAARRPWDDPSGDRLRSWMGVDRSTFYDDPRIGALPMGLCFPGVENGSDLPPLKRCGPLWQPRFAAALPDQRLTLLVGGYAQRFHLQDKRSMTDVVRDWRAFGPATVPLPHPSWRNAAWLKRNPWFDAEIVPALQAAVAAILTPAASASA